MSRFFAFITAAITLKHAAYAYTSKPEQAPDKYKSLKLPEKMQQDFGQVWKILKHLDDSSKKNLLSFSVGYDSPFWHSEVVTKRNGVAVFLEDDLEWIKIVKKIHKQLKIMNVSYSTKIIRDFVALESDFSSWCKILPMELNSHLRSSHWDVVLVDGPQGHMDNMNLPGRFQSLFEAARLVAVGGHIVVDDCNRITERLFADIFYGSQNLLSATARSGKEKDTKDAHGHTVFPNVQCIYRATADMPARKAAC